MALLGAWHGRICRTGAASVSVTVSPGNATRGAAWRSNQATDASAFREQAQPLALVAAAIEMGMRTLSTTEVASYRYAGRVADFDGQG
jgi:hypothetical protein